MRLLSSFFARVGAVEKWMLVVFAILAVLMLSFALLAREVFDGSTRAFDQRVLLLFRMPDDLSRPLGPPWLRETMRDVTALGSTVVLTIIVASVAGFLMVSRLSHTALLVLVSVLSGVLLSSALKATFLRPRPDLIPHDTPILTASFPSGHATLSAVVFLTLGALLCRTQSSQAAKAYILGVAVLLAVIVGISRVYLGVHWPTDVAAGWLLGSAWALMCWFVMVWLQSRGDVEPEQSVSSQKA
jgi:undecaprenyl-diphosphatase